MKRVMIPDMQFGVRQERLDVCVYVYTGLHNLVEHSGPNQYETSPDLLRHSLGHDVAKRSFPY